MAIRWSGIAPGKGLANLAAQGVDEASFLDPYVRWALKTSGRAFIQTGRWAVDGQVLPDGELQILMRARDRVQFDRMLTTCKAWGLPHACAPSYNRPLAGAGQWAQHFTLQLPFSAMHQLLKLTEEDGLPWELALPLRKNDTPATGTPHGRWGPMRDNTPFAASNVLAHALGEQRSELTTACGAVDGRGTIAVIDFGCPFLHERFTRGVGDACEARVKALWDQGSDPKSPFIAESQKKNWPWQAPRTFNYGRELSVDDIQKMVQAVRNGSAPGAVTPDETAAYRGIDYLIAYEDPRRRIWHSTHGGHVLDVAGGTVDPLLRNASLETADAASKADLVFVQLPSLAAADSSGGSLSAHLLDGIRYVLDIADPASPLVINISYGSYAGPHNGSALIETAMAELLALRQDNFAIVLAAGNARQAASHMRREVRRGKSALFQAQLVDGDSTDTFIEFWYDAAADPTVELQARVRGPAGDWSGWCAPGDQILLTDLASGEIVAMLRSDLRVPNGDRAMMLLAVSPTLQPDSIAQTPAPAGDWDVEVRLMRKIDAGSTASKPEALPSELEVVVDAWIERDEPGLSSGLRSHFVGLDREDNKNTLSSLATGAHTVVVGGVYRHDGRVTPYSSEGPRVGKDVLPQIWAACEEGPEEKGLLAAAVRSSEVFRMNGTSVAAPVVARRLFNLMHESRIDRTAMQGALKDLCTKYGDLVRSR